jgi:hypothetical protein
LAVDLDVVGARLRRRVRPREGSAVVDEPAFDLRPVGAVQPVTSPRSTVTPVSVDSPAVRSIRKRSDSPPQIRASENSRVIAAAESKSSLGAKASFSLGVTTSRSTV